MVGESGEWLKAAQVLAGSEPPLLHESAYHCQHSAEKSFTGSLTFHNTPFRKTHSLEELGEQSLRIDATLRDLVETGIHLTEYAWRFRYPGEPEDLDAREVAVALGAARKIYEAILARLPEEARS